MELKDLQQNWLDDSTIDQTKLNDEAARSISLHAKYINILSTLKFQMLTAEKDYIRIRRIKTKYYNGEMTLDELKHYELDQWQAKKPTKTVMEELLQSDEDLIDYRMKIEELTILRDYTESVVKTLNSRVYAVRDIINYLQWSQGSM
jgi:hypothetical protein